MPDKRRSRRDVVKLLLSVVRSDTSLVSSRWNRLLLDVTRRATGSPEATSTLRASASSSFTEATEKAADAKV